MKLMQNRNLNRFSESNRECLSDYTQANGASEQKKIIEKIIANEEKCLWKNEDHLEGMHYVNNTKSIRELLLLALFIVLASAAAYFVFTFLVVASIISVPIFLALCFVSGALFTKGIGYSLPELDHQKRICSDKIQLIKELQAELKRLNVLDSEETMEKSSSSKKLNGSKKSNVCFFQPAEQEKEESKNIDTNNLTSVNASRFK